MEGSHGTAHPAVRGLGASAARWSDDALVREELLRHALRGATGDADGVLLALDSHGDHYSPPGVRLVGLGDPVRVAELVREYDGAPVRSASLPRSIGAQLGPAALDALGLEALSTWDWLMIRAAPTGRPAAPDAVGPSATVERLDPVGDADAIRDVLHEANPRTDADPGEQGTAGWWGVRGAGGLVGVIGAVRLGHGRSPHGTAVPWHLHGLGVRPQARGRGAGAALTAAAVRDALGSNASWASLGMYADNDGARRIYHRLGFTTGHRFESYRRA